MFRRRASNPDTPADDRDGPGTAAGKGHATPSRREAQQARKQSIRIPKDPKAARAAARDRDRASKERARAGMMAGDERYLPVRDKGPAKAFARDFVDARFTFAEFFIFVALGVLALGFIPNTTMRALSSPILFGYAALVVIDTIIILFLLTRRARKAFPNAADRKGLMLYATMRSLQFRRLRLPPPRVRRGGEPLPPKATGKR